MTTAVEVAEKGHQLAAWVNFDGTLAMTVGSSYGPDAPPADYSSPNPIRASFNVASITDNGPGNYTVNFATAMPDANYTTVISFGNDSGGSGSGWWISRIVSTGTTGVQIYSGRQDNYVRVDATNANLSIFH